ncbi:MAG: glutamate--tRNA ligase [Methanocalculus sp. MSAO_Arc1]|uniref:glutamate--tRNA ligase n=1 Tax=Methanocalculus TaxID=71151 RepID=UPI000FED7B49|nr:MULTISPECIES: glutamate--tRNA ligase [unclassified Methanocalculus]MCP1662255.1 glutamyl-tRNA synthetase [Methanocalculus sp. AMF5]RQD81709.1 MAG: glutamate--tRNA ligase [Methanocalculus sp. MSAO_Arc1]
MEDRIKTILEAYALQNAVKHANIPRAGAVIGAVLGVHPELRKRAKELNETIGSVLDGVAALSHEEREERLLAIAPELSASIHQKRERSTELPPLPDGERGVVMRFAPNPSGPLHLGHARASVLNDAYIRRYGGDYIYRIEDTDPKRIDPDAYTMVQEDLEWLGVGISDIVYQSDRLEIYYAYAKELIALGGAYVCTCEAERFRELKLAKKACPCRDLAVEEQMERYAGMFDGRYAEGEVTVRIRTEIDHPDPAIRDFSAMRIVTSTIHPRVDATVYPLMNFSVAIDDHLLGMTHVIRGKDHIANTRRQKYIFDYFGWKQPHYLHYGRMSIEGLVLSTSSMHEGIRNGTYSGWDDIRLGTLRALARRGIRPEAVQAVITEIGIGETDISFSWDNLFAKNRDLIDRESNRYFFVRDPVSIRVEGAPEQVAEAPRYPGDSERGFRKLRFTSEILIPGEEVEAGKLIRIKDLFNIRVTGEGTAGYAGDSLADARAAKAPIIQWLPREAAIPCTVLTPEGPVTGYCEEECRQYQGRTVQFERFGFVRIDSVDEGKVVAYFTHR